MPEKTTVLTVNEVAKELGICQALAYRQIRAGVIPSIRVGDRYLIPRIAFEKMLANCQVKTPSRVRQKNEKIRNRE